MKKIKYASFILLGITILGAGGVISLASNNFKKANAYAATKVDNIKNINLNTVSDNDIKSYYNDITGISGQNNILPALKYLLSDGQQYFSYDIGSGNDIWKLYEITDRDWDKSPAIQIQGYDSNTNTITGYTYGVSDPYVHALYVNRDADNPKTAWKKHNEAKNPANINREHVWAKSHGFDESGQGGARGDPMHLMAADGHANTIHNNFNFGYVDTTKKYTDASDEFSTLDFTKNNLLGTTIHAGEEGFEKGGTVFEPQDSDKGDIARAIFYMAARYNNIDGLDKNINTDNPDLRLSNYIDMSSGTSTNDKFFSMGILEDLLKWNELDPVDDYEIKRNDILFRNYTKNRNPFIDYPQWANYIWGDEQGTPLYPNTDPIHGEKEEGVVLSLSSKKISMRDDNFKQTIEAFTNDDKTYEVDWSVDDESVLELSTKKTSTKEIVSLIPKTIIDDISKPKSVTITAKITYEKDNVEIIKTANCKVSVISKHAFDVIDVTLDKNTFSGATDKSVVGTANKSVYTANDLSLHYSGLHINSQNHCFYSHGDTKSTLGFIYNETAPIGYYVSEITITFASTTTAGGMYSVLFGDSVMNTIDPSPSVEVPINTDVPVTFTNTDEDNLYWSLSTAYTGKNLHILSVVVTYNTKDAQLVLDKELVEAELSDVSTNVTASILNFGSYGNDVKYTFESSNENIATVTATNNVATINFIENGFTFVQCTVSNDIISITKQISIKIGVASRELESIEVSEGGVTNFTSGDPFVNKNVYAKFTNSSVKEDVTSDTVFSGYDMNGVGTQLVTASYTYEGVTKSDSYTITLVEPDIKEYKTLNPIQKQYYYGEPFNAPVYIGVHKNGTYIRDEILQNVSFSDFNPTQSGEQLIIVTYNNKEISRFTVTVGEKVLFCKGIELTNIKTRYQIDNTFVKPTVTATYSNGFVTEYIDVTNKCSFNGFDSSTPGSKTITVTYIDETSIFEKSYVIEIAGSFFTYRYNDYYSEDTPLETEPSGEFDPRVYKYGDEECFSLSYGDNKSQTKPKYYAGNYNEARFYKNNYFIVKSSKTNIVKIQLNYAQSSTKDISTTTGNFDANSGVWTMTNNTPVQSVQFNMGENTGVRRILSISVFYYTADNFAEEFDKTVFGCDPLGNQKPSIDWELMESKYNQLYNFEQETLKNMTGKESGSPLEQLIARYDYIVSKYGINVYKDFMKRGHTSVNNSFYLMSNLFGFNSSNTNTIIIVVVIGFTLVSSIAYLNLKRKK